MTEPAYDLSQHSIDLPNTVPEDKGTGGQRVETFGSFLIGDMEFVLPVGVVQEVVNEPEEVSPVPLSPSYMHGLFNLRGMIVPLIDLREIFGFPPIEKTGDRKITIIEDGEMHLGLVFDKTGEVIHAQRSERVLFQTNENGIKDVISEGVLKLDGGARILQILDPYSILKLEKVPRVRKDAAGHNRSSRGKRRHCISFEVGHSKYAFELQYVQEVMEVPEIKHSVLTHGHVLGTINLRGRIVPIVDFRGFVGRQNTNSRQVAASQSNKLLIMNLLEGQIGLLVYSIDSIIPYFNEDVLPISKLAMPHEAIFQGCLAVDNSDLVMLFDHAETMKQPELMAAAQCCQELYPEGAEDVANDTTTSRERRTFITFSVDTHFAIDVTRVREVINRPEALMKPPNAPQAVAGLFNLRDEIITLIDIRVLYNLQSVKGDKQKVVIFQSNGQKFGIIVDTVDEIIMTTADKVMPYNGATVQGSGPSAIEDISEMVQLTTSEQGSKSVMALDVDALVANSTLACQPIKGGV